MLRCAGLELLLLDGSSRPQSGEDRSRVAVRSEGDAPGVRQRACHLAAELGLPVVHRATGDVDLILVVRDHRIELQEVGVAAPGPVYADFVGRRLGSVRRFPGGRRQPLGRAVGLAGGTPTVIDATAGLGRDAFRLACWGCTVTALERSPVVAALLSDGLRRARQVPMLEEIIVERLKLIVGDAREMLDAIDGDAAPDVVYLDPMYQPSARNAALVKKEMRIFRRLVGDDRDAGELLESARRAARRRVVVKRMHHAPPLAADPDLTYTGSIVRYDVYLGHVG